MNVNDFLRLTTEIKTCADFTYQAVRPCAVAADGFTVSIQASDTHYCSPRFTAMSCYHEVELGYPSQADDLIQEYAETPEEPTGTVYGYVPVSVVDALMEKHGGIVGTGTLVDGTLVITKFEVQP